MHGTAISLTHIQTSTDRGEAQVVPLLSRKSRSILPLPDSYTNVKAVTKLPVTYSASNTPVVRSTAMCNKNKLILSEQRAWLDNVKTVMANDNLELEDNLSWEAFHASNQGNPPHKHEHVTSALLPIFREKATSLR